jgi:thioredoxin reductase (NADPH)
VGGGNSAVEEGLFLTRFAKEVYLVHRRDQLRADPIIQQRAFANPKIKFVWDSVATEVLGNGKVSGIRLKNIKTGSEDVLETDAVFPYIGHIPNTELFKDQIDRDLNGFILTDGRTRTNVPGVFACGDVVDHVYRQAITAAGQGCMAAMEASWYLDNLDAQALGTETVAEGLGSVVSSCVARNLQ